MTGTDYLKNWKLGDDIGIIFDDVNKEGLTQQQLNEMFLKLHALAAEYGFGMKMWGVKADFDKSLNKEYARKKWNEGAQKMLDKLLLKLPVECMFIKHYRNVEPTHDIVTAPEFEI